jgi:hypothetical protein
LFEFDILLKHHGLHVLACAGAAETARFRDEFVAKADRWKASIRLILRGRFQEFEAIAPGIFGVKAADARDGSVVRNFAAAS